MKLTVYERVGHEGRRPSPFSWRIRYAMAHKGLEPEFVGVKFSQADEIERLSGQRLVPVLVHGDTVVADSWAIAEYLESAFPHAPSLYGGERGKALARFFNQWVDEILHPAVRKAVVPEFLQMLDAGDRAYFRSSRELQLGCALEDLKEVRPQIERELHAILAPLRSLLTRQAFVSGESAAYADYLAFGAFQYLRFGRPDDIIGTDGPLFKWRARVISLFGNLGDRYPGHPQRA